MIAEKYEALGNARAPQEAQNLVFSALFLADELHELKTAPPPPPPEPIAPLPSDESPRDDHEPEEQKGKGGKKAELRAEIEELKKSERKLKKQRDALVKELADLRSGAEDTQVDMFGEDVLASRLEDLAKKVEAAADALEGNSL